MAAFDENSFGRNTAFSDQAFDFGAAVVTALFDYVTSFRRRRRR